MKKENLPPISDSIGYSPRFNRVQSSIVPYLIIALFTISHVRSQNEEPAESPTKTATADLEIETPAFFTDMVVTALVKFPEIVETPTGVSTTDTEISIVDIEVNSETTSVASIRFMPRKPGLITIPSFEFQSETTTYQTKSKQIMVSTPTNSEAMALSMVPEKTTVYAGEPLRIDVTWSADLPTNQIRSLQCFPELFSRPDAKIVIPRPTVPEDQQIGLPFGGRRIVAARTPPEGNQNKLGKITFPVFVKFEEPGEVTVPPTRLEIAHLKDTGGALAPYAVFFNNGLFEPRTSLQAFDRYYTESTAIDITVIPLPTEGQTEAFSGLFAPCSITPTVKTTEISVGDVIEVGLRVRSNAPHGMLELPELGIQRSLRGRYRSGTEYGRTWYADGTGFSGRIRALTTDITALPSLQFQIFNPDSSKYEFIQTEPLPLSVKPDNERNFYDIRNLAPETTLTNQPEGVWHNAQPTRMNDIMNHLISFLAEKLWILLLLGPIAFAILLPRVRESRRRAIEPIYRAQAEAYDAFQQLPEKSQGKWEAFLGFLATGFSMPGPAWTPGDAADRLRSIGVHKTDIEQVLATHQKMDTTDFSADKPENELPELNELAHRLFDHFKQVAPVLIGALLISLSTATASDWDEAESLFNQAISAPVGEPDTESLFTQSALKFEAAANARNRPGSAWFNAGNSWFKAGEIGRAIGCYRQAKIYRPFDDSIKDNLTAARALSVDVVEDSKGISLNRMPVRWLSATLVLVSWIFIATLLIHIRYRNKSSLAGVIASLFFLLFLTTVLLSASSHSGKEGVIIVSSIYARKGPAYHYRQAFNEPLHDGLELDILEQRDQWLRISLADDRKGWIPASQVRLIENNRR